MNNPSKTVVVVPEWIATQIRRDGGTITDVLNYGRISQILSNATMAELLLFNDPCSREYILEGKTFGDLIFGQRPNVNYSLMELDLGDQALVECWSHLYEKWSVDSGYEGIDKLCAMAKLVIPQADQAFFRQADEGECRIPADGEERPWRFVHGDNVIFVIIKPKAFYRNGVEGNQAAQAYRLRLMILTDLMREQYAYRYHLSDRISMLELTYIDSLRFANA